MKKAIKSVEVFINSVMREYLFFISIDTEVKKMYNYK